MSILAEQGLVENRDRSSRIVRYALPPSGSAGHAEPGRPQIVLIGGYAGSGKTELGRILARKTRWALLDKDSTTRAVVEAALEECGQSPHDRESETYLRRIRPAEYEALLTAAMENIEVGTSVLATAPFWSEFADRTWCDRVASQADSLGADLRLIWLRCDADTMRTYIKRRGAARDASKLASWEAYLASIDLEFTPVAEHRVIDNSADQRPLQEQADGFLREVATP